MHPDASAGRGKTLPGVVPPHRCLLATTAGQGVNPAHDLQEGGLCAGMAVWVICTGECPHAVAVQISWDTGCAKPIVIPAPYLIWGGYPGVGGLPRTRLNTYLTLRAFPKSVRGEPVEPQLGPSTSSGRTARYDPISTMGKPCLTLGNVASRHHPVYSIR